MGFNKYQKVSAIWFLVMSLFNLHQNGSVQVMISTLIALIVWTIILGDKK